jgi:hypothetical protein
MNKNFFRVVRQFQNKETAKFFEKQNFSLLTATLDYSRTLRFTVNVSRKNRTNFDPQP